MAPENLTTKMILIFGTLIAVFLCSVNCTYAAAAALKKSDFAFAVTFKGPESSKPWLVGKFKAGTSLTLLLSKPPNTCTLKTTSHREQTESSGADLTEILGSCKTSEENMVAVLGKPVWDYERISLKEVSNSDEIATTDRSIRNSKALLTLLKKAQDLIPGKIKELEGVVPKVHEVLLPGSKVRIATYENSSDENAAVSGPRVIVINDRAYPLTGWCSYKTLNIFRLNGQHYIQTGSCCRGCGITIMELFRITPDGPVEVVSDASLSD